MEPVSKLIPLFPLCANCKVGGDKVRLSICCGCKAVYYCGAQCQKIDWPAHKKSCNTMSSNMREIVDVLIQNYLFVHKMKMLLALLNKMSGKKIVLGCNIIDYSDVAAYKCELSCVYSTKEIVFNHYYVSFDVPSLRVDADTPFMSFNCDLCCGMMFEADMKSLYKRLLVESVCIIVKSDEIIIL
jgi:hypothetical protein